MRYTIRRVPKAVDEAIRDRARESGKSLNEVVVDALALVAAGRRTPQKGRDLDDVAGTWRADRRFEAALADQHGIDKSLWR